MAKQVLIDIEVNADGGAKSLKALKVEFKETQKELDGLTVGTKQYTQTLSKLAKVKDEIEDLNDEIKAFQGAGKFQAFSNVAQSVAGGFQAAQGAAALFGAESENVQKALLKVQAASALAEGLKSLEGMKDGFKALAQVIRANPIFLLVTVIAGIATSLYALKDKVSWIGDMFDGISKYINNVIKTLKDFTDLIGATNFALTKSYEDQLAAIKKVNEEIQGRYDFEIKLAQAAGKETIELERKKFEATRESIMQQVKIYSLLAAVQGKFTDDQKKALEELKKEYVEGTKAFALLVVADDKKKDDKAKADAKKRSDDKKKADDEAFQEAEYRRKTEQGSEELQEEALQKIIDDAAKKKKDSADKLWNEDEAARDKQREIENAKEKSDADSKLKIKSANIAAINSLEQSSFQSLAAIGEIFISNSNKLKQFQKGLALSQIAIDTAKSISSLIASSQANPTNAVTGGLSGAAQFASGLTQILVNIAKAKQLITSSDSGSTPSISNASTSGTLQGNFSQAPQLNPVNNTSTLLVNGGGSKQQAPIKAYVVETDATQSMNKIKKYEDNSKF